MQATLALDQALDILRERMPDEEWDVNDDLCDCTFQRIGYWHNPYVGEVLEVRMCCIWKELYKQFPQFVRVTKHEPAAWNGETQMPKSLWVRQLANLYGCSVKEARAKNLMPPAGQPRKEPVNFYLQWSGEWIPVELAHSR